MNGVIARIMGYTAWRMEAQPMFGAFHISVAVIMICLAVCGALLARHMTDTGRLRLLTITGWVLAVLEIYKQLFLLTVVNGGVYDWWFFPFQLCSVPMYMCILIPVLTGSRKTPGRHPGSPDAHSDARGSRCHALSAVLTFMLGFTFISSVAALIYPEDILRSYVTLTLHGFIWHGLLLFISLVTGFSGMADLSARGIARSVALFLVMCAVAVGINAAAEQYMAHAYGAGLITHNYAAMFYLNPYHLSPQLLVGTVQKSAGIPAGLALYVLVIILVSVITDLVFKAILSRSSESILTRS